MIALATMGMVEIVLRITGLAPPRALSTVSEADFQRLPGIFDPGQVLVQQPGTQFQHTVTIDSLGYRGGNFPRARPVGETRVLFAGDSFTFGHNVEDDETLPAQLQRMLQARCGAARVINAGLPGSTILAQAELVRRGLVLDPSVVIVMYHENDIDELAHVRIWDQLAHNRRVKSAFPTSLAYRAARHTAIGGVALQARVSFQLRRQTLGRQTLDQDTTDAHHEWVEPARSEYASTLKGVAKLLNERDVPLVFVAFPHPESVMAGTGARDYAWVVRTAYRLGLPAVDLLHDLVGSGVSVNQLYLVPGDYHPSAAGHAFAAARIAETLSCAEPESP
jgi:lysophospholipase L1-like esterase